MNKKFSKLTALLLSLAMALSLVLPAGAAEDTDPPQWEKYGYSSLEELLTEWDITEEEYYQQFAKSAIEIEQLFAQQETERQAWIAAHPNEVAAFDPYSYFEKEYHWYESAQEYMEYWDITPEEFERKMLLAWVMDAQALGQEKELFGGSAAGINVMVNGQCIPFPDARPELNNSRTMVPLAAAMEFLGAQVSYDKATRTASVSMDELSFTHVIGTDTLKLSDGSTVKMDTASYIKEGRTMVPVRFFSEVLGYEVFWDSEYQTAVLIDRDKMAADIDQEFTLFNRILYALSGGAAPKEGQAVEQSASVNLDIVLFDSIRGNQSSSAKLTGSILYSGSATQIKLNGNLSPLVDLLSASYWLDGDEQKEYRSALSNLSIEYIANLEAGVCYLHAPALAKLGLLPLEDPNAWAAIPVELGQLGLDALSVSPAMGQLSVGALDMSSPFWAYNDAVSTAGQLYDYVGDPQFTKAGSTYTAVFTPGDEESWWLDEENFSGSLKITPSGEHSCTYSLALQLSDSDAVCDVKVNGSTGKTNAELLLHLKNEFKFTWKSEHKVAAVSKQPPSAPPAGSKLEFPLGMIGSGSM